MAQLINNNYTYGDNLTWQKGLHLFKFGAQFIRYQQNIIYSGVAVLTLALAFAFCCTASSQSLTVDNNLGHMVRKYLDQRADHQIAERQKEIAAIKDKAAVQTRQAYIRKIFRYKKKYYQD